MSDHMEFEGVVVRSCGNGLFQVQIEDIKDKIIVCSISGKIRQNSIKIIEGDPVKVKVSLYDSERGIIFFRGKDKFVSKE